MVHDVLDIARWRQTFPLSNWREDGARYVQSLRERMPDRYPTRESIERQIAALEPGGQGITSPVHIAMIEQIRDQALRKELLAGLLRTDVFVFGRGEPTRRELTKVGGLPYWPAPRPWPQATTTAAPMTFVAQICFLDSSDLMGRLPGDILLIFASGEAVTGVGEQGELRFEWVRLGESPLVESAEIPATEWVIPTYYGEIHRTVDYPGAQETFKAYPDPGRIAVLEGTKIGGVARWMPLHAGPPGRHLCSLASLHAATLGPHPYVNDPEPIAYRDPREGHNLTWGGHRSLSLFLDDRGQIIPCGPALTD